MEPTRRISHYRLIEKIGEGGMGVVWKAEDAILGRTVAVKVLPADASRNEGRRAMFLEEARLASSLSDAHIAQIYEFGREGDLDFIVMEYIEGKPLSRVLHGRPLPPDKVAGLGIQAARALSRAHRKGLLHRDLKPSNLLVTEDGEVKVVDFGLATLFERGETTPGSDETTRTEGAGSVETRRPVRAGTLPYMSPEQVRGDRLDSRSDIFSLGVVLYEMSTGQRPFAGATGSDLAAEVARARFKPPHELVAKLPLELDRIVQKSLAARPEDRYQTMDDLAVDLKRLERELESGSAPSYGDLGQILARGRRRLRLIAGCAAGAGLALAAAGWWLASTRTGRLDEKTILVMPLTMSQGREGADVAGLAVAQGLAVSLAQAPSLKLLPVPEGPVAESERLPMARRLGAGRLLTGMLVREPHAIQASVSLIDTRSNRIVWGTQSRIESADLAVATSALGREALSALNVQKPRMYEYIEELAPEGPMANSVDLAAALGAMRQSDFHGADEAAARLVSAFPGESDAWALQAYCKLNLWDEAGSREPHQALDASLARLAALDPANPYLQQLSAFVTGYEGRTREAIEGLSTLLSRDDLAPRFRAWTLGVRADHEISLGEFSEAERDLREAVGLNPTGAGPRGRLSLLFSESGRYEEAIAWARQAVALDPGDFYLYGDLGFALERAGRWSEAAEAYRKAVDLNRSQITLSQLGQALMHVGRRREGLEIAREAERLPDQGDGCFNLACTWVFAGDRRRALAFLHRAVAAGMSSAVDLENDACLAPLRGDPEFEAVLAEVKKRMGKEP